MQSLKRMCSTATALVTLDHSTECQKTCEKHTECALTNFIRKLPLTALRNVQEDVQYLLTSVAECAASRLILLVLSFRAVRPICFIDQCLCTGAVSSLRDSVKMTCYDIYNCDCLQCTDYFYGECQNFREMVQESIFRFPFSCGLTLTTLHIGLLSDLFVNNLHYFENLKHICVEPSTKDENSALRNNVEQFLLQLPTYCQQLEVLYIVTGFTHTVSVPVTALEPIKYNRNLRYLRLNIISVTTELAVCLIRSLPKLESIALKRWGSCLAIEGVFQKLKEWEPLQFRIKTLKWDAPVDVSDTSTEFLRTVCGPDSPDTGLDYNWKDDIDKGDVGSCLAEGKFGPCTRMYFGNPNLPSLMKFFKLYFAQITHVNLDVKTSVVEDNYIEKVVRVCGCLETLQIVASDVAETDSLNVLGSVVTRLKTLDVQLRNGSSRVIVTLMKFIVTSSPGLETVAVHFGDVVVTEPDMIYIFDVFRVSMVSLCLEGYNLELPYSTLLDFLLLYPNLRRVGYVNMWWGFEMEGSHLHETQGRKLIEKRKIRVLRCPKKGSINV